MEKLSVDINTCIGCGYCASCDSNHFTINDAGLSEVISQDNLDTPTLQEVIDGCPVGAIKLNVDNNSAESEEKKD